VVRPFLGQQQQWAPNPCPVRSNVERESVSAVRSAEKEQSLVGAVKVPALRRVRALRVIRREAAFVVAVDRCPEFAAVAAADGAAPPNARSDIIPLVAVAVGDDIGAPQSASKMDKGPRLRVLAVGDEGPNQFAVGNIVRFAIRSAPALPKRARSAAQRAELCPLRGALLIVAALWVFARVFIAGVVSRAQPQRLIFDRLEDGVRRRGRFAVFGVPVSLRRVHIVSDHNLSGLADPA